MQLKVFKVTGKMNLSYTNGINNQGSDFQDQYLY